MTEESLDKRILSWLDTQGYGVEMQVAKQLNVAGFDTIKSYFYDDPETGISREIDVIGRLTDDIGILYVYTVIECKKSSNPWIVFSSDNGGFNRAHSFAIMTDRAREAMLNNLAQAKKIDLFMKKGRIGYGIATAFTSKDDETFKAGIAATKAAISIIKKEAHPSGHNPFFFLFPTVVIDGRLFESYLGDDEKPVVVEIDSASLLFPVKIGEYYGSSIQIVTSKSFDEYCRQIRSVYDSLKELLRLEE